MLNFRKYLLDNREKISRVLLCVKARQYDVRLSTHKEIQKDAIVKMASDWLDSELKITSLINLIISCQNALTSFITFTNCIKDTNHQC